MICIDDMSNDRVLWLAKYKMTLLAEINFINDDEYELVKLMKVILIEYLLGDGRCIPSPCSFISLDYMGILNSFNNKCSRELSYIYKASYEELKGEIFPQTDT